MIWNSTTPPRGRVHRPEPHRTREQLQEMVRHLDPKLAMDSPTARAALVVLAGLQMPHNIVRIANVTGIAREFVARCARRLVDNGVWVNGETLCGWSAGERNQPAFWADVAVAEGKLCRRSDEEGRLQWAPQGTWWKSFDHSARANAEMVTHYHTPEVEREAPDEQRVEIVARGEQTGPSAASDSELFPGAVWL